MEYYVMIEEITEVLLYTSEKEKSLVATLMNIHKQIGVVNIDDREGR